MKNLCNIIKDIIPLYIEDMVSEDTKVFVEEHINECNECKTLFDNMVTPKQEIIKDDNADLVPLKTLKQKMTTKKIITIIASSLTTTLLVLSLIFTLTLRGFMVSSNELSIEKEFQYNEYAYLNQAFVLHLITQDNKPLFTTVEEIYGENENGEQNLEGYVITPRVPIFNFGQNPDNYTFGYSYSDAESNPGWHNDYDVTISVKFKDKTVVYSMTQEGLFEKQENVVNYNN